MNGAVAVQIEPSWGALTITPPHDAIMRVNGKQVASFLADPGAYASITVHYGSEDYCEYLAGDDLTRPPPVRQRNVVTVTAEQDHT